MTFPQAVHMDFGWDDPRVIRDFDLSDPARPIDNVTLVVGGDAATGRVDFITKWKPGHYCTYHRHLGETVSVVLAGEHWVESEDGSLRCRPPGNYARTAAGERHREFAGPHGSTVFFSIHSPQGGAFQSLDAAGQPVSEGSTIAQLVSRLDG
jgi:hypothetical protein